MRSREEDGQAEPRIQDPLWSSRPASAVPASTALASLHPGALGSTSSPGALGSTRLVSLHFSRLESTQELCSPARAVSPACQALGGNSCAFCLCKSPASVVARSRDWM